MTFVIQGAQNAACSTVISKKLVMPGKRGDELDIRYSRREGYATQSISCPGRARCFIYAPGVYEHMKVQQSPNLKSLETTP